MLDNYIKLYYRAWAGRSTGLFAELNTASDYLLNNHIMQISA